MVSTATDFRPAGVRAAKNDLNSDAAGRYARHFGTLAIVVGRDAQAAEEVAERLRGHRPGAVVVQLASFLDDWSLLVRGRPEANRITAVARALDPDPWRNRLRGALSRPEPADVLIQLGQLASEADVNAQPAPTLTLLANALTTAGGADSAIALLERARWRYRDDVWVFEGLGLALRSARPPRNLDALRAFAAASALQPAMAFDLAIALRDAGQTAEGIAVLEDLVGRLPTPLAYFRLGEMQADRGLKEHAQASILRSVELSRRQIRLHPGDARAHNILGVALLAAGDARGAATAFREAIRLMPDLASAHSNLGNALIAEGKLPVAIGCFREAIRTNPGFAEAYSNRGAVLTRMAELLPAGSPEHTAQLAVAAFREAIRLKPDYADAHFNLGCALMDRGRLDEAILSFREAIRLKPGFVAAHGNLEATRALAA